VSEFEEAQSELDAALRRGDEYKRQRDALTKSYDQLVKKCDLLVGLDAVKADRPPTWLHKPSKSHQHQGIANLMLSDLHLDETVFPGQMGGVNAYNREIAVMRLKSTVENTAEIAHNYITGYRYEGITAWLGGDVFSGNIHEELKQTNAAPIMASFDFWVDPMVAALKYLADAFGKVHVPGCVGNHGRNTYKPVMKNRVEDNFDWLFYRVLFRELKSDKRFTWQLPVTTDVSVTHYDHRYLLTHGDQFRGGSGIAGIQTPLALGAYKKGRRNQAVGNPFDTMLLGHFHQLMFLPGVMVNGSLKGYDEYAATANFGYEVPQQAFWISTPERGPIFHLGIQPQNREREGW
jgi:hypothetical protein